MHIGPPHLLYIRQLGAVLSSAHYKVHDVHALVYRQFCVDGTIITACKLVDDLARCCTLLWTLTVGRLPVFFRWSLATVMRLTWVLHDCTIAGLRVRYDFVVAICLNDLRANSFPHRATDCTGRLGPLHVWRSTTIDDDISPLHADMSVLL